MRDNLKWYQSIFFHFLSADIEYDSINTIEDFAVI